MARYVELRRHTDNDGDELTPEGVRAAVELGRRLDGEYQVLVSSGAQRATQTAGCILAGLGRPVPGGVLVQAGLRSDDEDRWRAAYRTAGAGDLDSLRRADPEFVADDCRALGNALRLVFALLQDGQCALAVGHSPTNEAAIYGLTGTTVAPLGKGEGFVITEEGDRYTVEPAG